MCGIIGILTPKKPDEEQPVNFIAAYEAYRGLLSLQHRGQDAAGILAYDHQLRNFSMRKKLGLVSHVFDDLDKVEKLTGHMAIGHTRYATAGTDSDRDIQPMLTGSPFGSGMVHNGNILNYFSLVEDLAEHYGRQMLTSNDLEVIMHYWGLFMMNGNVVPTEQTFSFENIKQAVSKMHDTLNGGYAVITMVAGRGLVAFRDPQGIRPLTLGTKETDAGTVYCLSSETGALGQLGYEYIRDVAPGEVIFIDSQGQIHAEVVGKAQKIAPCMFEWVYFSSAEGKINNQSIYSVRLKLGERLAQKARSVIESGDISPDVVMPVPDTSRPAAISVADVLDIPYREGMIKNRYVARSFILKTQEEREQAVERKLSPIVSEVKGKDIFLIDDSVVRGTTSQMIVSMLRRYGAKRITLGITCPPIRYACYYGIDFPDQNALVAHDRDLSQIEKALGVEKVIYLDEEDLREAIGASALCMACINNKYPTSVSEGARFSKSRQRFRMTPENTKKAGNAV